MWVLSCGQARLIFCRSREAIWPRLTATAGRSVARTSGYSTVTSSTENGGLGRAARAIRRSRRPGTPGEEKLRRDGRRRVRAGGGEVGELGMEMVGPAVALMASRGPDAAVPGGRR